MKVLILFAHPAFQKSFTNRTLVEDIEKIEGVTFHDLYETYPEFDIDLEKEKELLANHDCIIFHHPFFWYSTPAILKEWQDIVLEHGWAFGTNGTALKGKLFFNVLTAGAAPQAYTTEGIQNHTINQLLSPLRQTATFCNMIPLPPFVVFGTHAINEEELDNYKFNYHQLLKRIVNDRIDLDEIKKHETLNEYLRGEDR